MDNSNLASKVIPEEWRPTSDWNSHRPMLFLALDFTVDGKVLEIGCGYGSTPLIEKYCLEKGRESVSYETNKEWADKFQNVLYMGSYVWILLNENQDRPTGSLCFIDCAPGEIRKDLIEALALKFEVIVVHDTEPGAEYVYHMAEVLNSFKYRCDLHIPGMPSTTAVSNKFDVSAMIGQWDEFTIV